MTSPAITHTREHNSLLADAEKRLLVWMAFRLPAGIGSDHLTLVALGSMLVAGAGFALMRVAPGFGWLVVAALAANWFGDSLDGTVARVRRQERPRYGFYVDHVVDLAGVTLLLGGLAISTLMAPALALALLVAYLLVAAEVYLATSVSNVFRLAFVGLGPTELRLLLAAGAIKATTNPYVSVATIGQVRLFDLGGAIAIVGLTVTFVISAVRQIRALYVAEPL